MSLIKIFQNAEYYRKQNDLKQLELSDQTDFSVTKTNKLESDKDLKSKLSECQEVINFVIKGYSEYSNIEKFYSFYS